MSRGTRRLRIRLSLLAVGGALLGFPLTLTWEALARRAELLQRRRATEALRGAVEQICHRDPNCRTKAKAAVVASEQPPPELGGWIFAFPALIGAGLWLWLLDRQLIAPLETLELALEQLSEREQASVAGPLAGEGDALERAVPAVRRLHERLREERRRVQVQIHELEAKNRELDETRADLARSERLASLGRLAAGLAHELGNPVSALIGYAALALERQRAGKEVADLLTRIAHESSRLDRILRNLLELARPSGPALVPVDLARALARARNTVVSQTGWDTTTQIDLSLAPSVLVWADELALEQVFVNLFLNSAKARARRVNVEVSLGSGSVVVRMADDGDGIEKSVLPRLFEPFFTTAAPGKGTGLGLALCHAALERFGGQIEASSAGPGAGAQFTLRLRHAGGVATASSASGSAATKRLD